MADFDFSSYPKPQAPQNPLDMITHIGQAADTIGNLQVGQAVQGAMGPDGQIDPNKLAQALASSPAGAMKAIPTLNALQTLRSAGYSADQAALDTFQKRMAITNHLFSGLASKDNPSIDDVMDTAAKAMDPGLNAKQYGITVPVIMGAIKQFYGPDGKPLPSSEIKKKALEIQTHAATTQEILAQHSPQVRAVQTSQGIQFQPGGTAANPAYNQTNVGLGPSTEVTDTRRTLSDGTPNPNYGGKMLLGNQPQPQSVPMPAARPSPNFNDRFGAAFPNATPSGPATSLGPGTAESIAAQRGQATQGANQLMTAANEVRDTKAVLDNLEEDLTKFTSGQGADWSRVAKNFVNRNIPMPASWKAAGTVLDENSLASQENFNKLAQMLAQRQFQALGGTGTDAKLSSAMATSPNEYLSGLGNKGIIRMLKGNQDAIAAKGRDWLAYKKANPDADYNEFSQNFNDNFDPRIFQFKYIPSKERQTYFNNMDPDEQQQFLRDMTYARKKKWVTF